MYGALDISTSGLIAQRTRLEIISANLANRETLLDENGAYAPYRRKYAMLAAGDPATGSALGVHVAAIETDQAELAMKYDPSSPFANKDGYVAYPNVNPVVEQMNAMEAMRSYEANITAAEATKSMIGIALQIIA